MWRLIFKEIEPQGRAFWDFMQLKQTQGNGEKNTDGGGKFLEHNRTIRAVMIL